MKKLNFIMNDKNIILNAAQTKFCLNNTSQ